MKLTLQTANLHVFIKMKNEKYLKKTNEVITNQCTYIATTKNYFLSEHTHSIFYRGPFTFIVIFIYSIH